MRAHLILSTAALLAAGAQTTRAQRPHAEVATVAVDGLGDRHVYAQRTRFIPNSVTRYFQSRYWPQSKSNGDATQRSSGAPIDLQAKMRRVWG